RQDPAGGPADTRRRGGRTPGGLRCARRPAGRAVLPAPRAGLGRRRARSRARPDLAAPPARHAAAVAPQRAGRGYLHAGGGRIGGRVSPRRWLPFACWAALVLTLTSIPNPNVP